MPRRDPTHQLTSATRLWILLPNVLVVIVATTTANQGTKPAGDESGQCFEDPHEDASPSWFLVGT